MIDEIMQQETTNTEESWTIENDQQAEWAIGKIKAAQADLDKWQRYYTAMIDGVKVRTEQTVSYMTEKLSEYFQTVPHRETKTQEKYSLPSGDLVLKKPKEVWNHDDGELLDWLKKNGFSEFVKVTEKPDWAGFKKRLAEDSNGILCDSETGLVCDVVKVKTTEPEFAVMNV